jgi:hypothetical protein
MIAGRRGPIFKTLDAWNKVMKKCFSLIRELVLFISQVTQNVNQTISNLKTENANLETKIVALTEQNSAASAQVAQLIKENRKLKAELLAKEMAQAGAIRTDALRATNTSTLPSRRIITAIRRFTAAKRRLPQQESKTDTAGGPAAETGTAGGPAIEYEQVPGLNKTRVRAFGPRTSKRKAEAGARSTLAYMN